MNSFRAGLGISLVCSVTFALLGLIAHADTLSASERAALQAQLAQVQAQIQDNQAKLKQQQATETSLKNTVATINSQITEAQLEIKQRDLTIKALLDGISQDDKAISEIDQSVVAGQASLAQLLRNRQQMDDATMAEIILGGSLSDIFTDADDYDQIQKALGDTFDQLASQRSDLSSREQALQNKHQEQSDLLQLQKLQQNSLKQSQTQKQALLAQTKGQESAYKTLIASQQQTAAQIQKQLFSLADSNTSVDFGDMYTYAKAAGAATNVDPAFILGIMGEESNLGQNVGNCTYQNAMSPTRDIPDYLQITQELGIDPDSQKVSCAQSYGAYGGAMGPAQFIPSTWMLYKDRIANASGQNPPNPWNPRTATFATALLLADNGADARTPAAERLAALRYLAGRAHANNPAYAFYGNAAMALKAKYQAQIDILNGS